MSQSSNERGRTEHWVGFIILLCLVGIAAGVYQKQFSFNPAVLVATPAAPAPATLKPVATVSNDSLPTLPPELSALSAPEMFTADNLYDKVDGKADLYLTAGFVGLQCQRLALKATNDVWMEWFVYDMGTLPQAFSVFSLQRRAEAQPLDLTPFAYQTQNSLYFVSGRYYVEAVTAMPTEPMMAAMRAMARQFVAAHPPGAAEIPELKLFPPENLEAGSQGLQIVDAFGFDQFTNVFTAKYRVPNGATNAEVLAFLELTKTPAAAAALRDAYRSFLLANGGKEIESQDAASIGKPIQFHGQHRNCFCGEQHGGRRSCRAGCRLGGKGRAAIGRQPAERKTVSQLQSTRSARFSPARGQGGRGHRGGGRRGLVVARPQRPVSQHRQRNGVAAGFLAARPPGRR
jgi:hypothetical protein